MAPINLFAHEIFKTYKIATERAVNTYNLCKDHEPMKEFPTIARHVWRVSVLAEAWGIITYKLNGQNVLRAWEEGR